MKQSTLLFPLMFSLLFALLLAPVFPQGNPAPDLENRIAGLTKFVTENPGHGNLYLRLAQFCAQAGKTAESVGWLNRALDTGIGLDLAGDPAFAGMRPSAEFQAVARRAAPGVKPLRKATLAFRLPQKDLAPEGIAYDPVGKAFYLGSIKKRQIFRLNPDGTTAEFTASGQEGLLGVLGLKVDAGRRRLWANCAGAQESGSPDGSAGLFAFDLETGKLLKKFIFDGKDSRHMFNDLTIAPNGDVYLTDSEAGRVYQAREGQNDLEVFCGEGGELQYLNGITVSEDGRSLYVEDFRRGFTRVDLATRALRTVARPADVSTFGVDGLYCHHGRLVGIQNADGVERVVRYDLDEAGDRIVRMRVLERGSLLYRIPMTGAIADGALYFVAYARRLDADGTLLPPEAPPQETVVMRLPLGW